jgi:choline dehydrogenase-like flavoprotein
MRVHQAALLLAFRLYNDRVDAVYDAIVIGAGAGGCPLTQTLIERGYETLLLERGGERNQNSQNKDTAVNALMNNNCIEEFDSQGVVVATGNCMGGATSYNQGIYIEEPENFLDEFGGLFSPDLVSDAFTYVRNFYAPEATSQTGKAATYTAELIEAMKTVGLTEANVAPGQPNYPTDGANIWRTHSIFEPTTGYRRSADTILDRTNSNLEIRTNSEVEKVLFCGDAGVPTCSDNETATTAKCVQFTSGNIACVRENGKIFLSAGAIHTPRLLIASGIGPHGSKVLNSEVGQNLSDKPGKGVTTFFKPGFDYEEEGYTYGEVAAIQKRTLSSGAEKTLLWEEVSTGPQEMANLLCFEQLVAPRDLRFSAFADEKTGLQEQCKEEIESGRLLGLSRECLPSLAAYSAGCYGSQSTLVSLVADPSSTGSVTVQADGVSWLTSAS